MEVPSNESSNCVWVNDHVLMPERMPKTKALIEEKGYKVIEIDVSEF